MVSRVVAAWLVLVLVGPSVVTATCELKCAMASHHHGTLSTNAPCHEHQGDTQDAGVHANAIEPCHESGDLPSAVVDARLNASVVPAVSTATVAITPTVTATPLVRGHESRTVFDPRPPHRPLRV